MRDVGDVGREAWTAYRRGQVLHGPISKIAALANVSGQNHCTLRKSKCVQDCLQS